ncbi:hypothetical protein, partial [Enterobacter hormaechei]|uniref:hypothetical protein n=1 Tax=Enterobacter hormaechei TaxID=158836 RepID=UPI0031FEED59
SKDGISYPFVNFVEKAHDAGSWSGFSFLFSEYRREQQRNGATVVAQPEEERARMERQAYISTTLQALFSRNDT